MQGTSCSTTPEVLVVIVFHTATSSLSYCHLSACLSAIIIIIGVQLIPMPVWDNNQWSWQTHQTPGVIFSYLLNLSSYSHHITAIYQPQEFFLTALPPSAVQLIWPYLPPLPTIVTLTQQPPTQIHSHWTELMRTLVKIDASFSKH